MFFWYKEAEEAEPVAGVKRKMLSCGERVQIIEFFLPKGAAFPLHTHPHEQTGYIASGKLHVRIGNEEADLGPGDGYFVPSNMEHGTMAIENCVNIDVFSPPRDEYRDR
ncbi:MAG: cupin domain-containing protein [Methanomassiliicoccales archaeon]|nr:cupin domain-containing protein [Methanomassiliicoccales archaeon]